MGILKSKLLNIMKLANNVGFLHLMSANILIQIAGFGGQIFLTRFLSVDSIGTLKVLQSYLNIFVIISSLGLNTSVLKICSENISTKEKINIFNLSLIFTIFSSTTLILLVFTLVETDLLIVNNLMKVYVFLIPFLSITNLIIVYLQSQQKIKTMSYIQSYSKVFIILLSTLFSYLLGLKGYIYSLVLLNIITFLFIVLNVKNELKYIFKTKISIPLLHRVFNIGLYAFGANLLGVLLFNANILMANYLVKDSREIGYYSIAQLIITTMMMIPSTFAQIMVPRLTKISNNLGNIKSSLRVYQLRNTALASTLAVLAAILGPLIIPLVFGKTYINSVLYFEILLIGFIFWSLYSPKGITLLSVGKTNLNFYISLISFILNMLLNYIFIKQFNMMGSALANALTNLITFFINGYIFKKFIDKQMREYNGGNEAL